MNADTKQWLDTQQPKLFTWMDSAEIYLTMRINTLGDVTAIRNLFIVASRLGNGVIWYILIAALPFVYDREGGQAAVQMVCTGAIGALLYKALKEKLMRQRPYISYGSIKQRTAVLDSFSFPSGHTLHAVCFSLTAAGYFPALTVPCVILAGLIAASRVVLGLHYPTDVLVGAAVGYIVARAGFYVTQLV
jgi:undecaprenyl-diphosphatase